MSSGVALSTPREHLNNIQITIKATGLFAATSRIGFGAAAKAYPRGSLLTERENLERNSRCDKEWGERKAVPTLEGEDAK